MGCVCRTQCARFIVCVCVIFYSHCSCKRSVACRLQSNVMTKWNRFISTTKTARDCFDVSEFQLYVKEKKTKMSNMQIKCRVQKEWINHWGKWIEIELRPQWMKWFWERKKWTKKTQTFQLDIFRHFYSSSFEFSVVAECCRTYMRIKNKWEKNWI